MKPRLIEAITLSELGGAQVVVRQLLEGLSHTFDLTLVCGGDGYLAEQSRRIGVRTVTLPTLGRSLALGKDTVALAQMCEVCSSLAPDLLHLHSTKMGILGAMCGALMDVATVFTVHGWGREGFGPRADLLAWIQRVAMGALSSIVCVSEADLRLAVSHGLAASYIPNGVIVPTTMKVHSPRGDVVVGAVGRVVPAKNFPLFLKVVQIIGRQFRNVQFVWMGGGELLHAAREQACQMGLANMTFVGEQSDAAQMMTDFDILLLTSKWEGMPLAVLEACAMGLPVVATPVGGVPELVESGWNGFLASTEDELAAGLARLIISPTLRQEMGTRGRDLARRFSVDRMVSDYRGLLERTLEQRGRGPGRFD